MCSTGATALVEMDWSNSTRRAVTPVSLAHMPESRGTPWTAIEIEVVVESYFRMLHAQLAGEPYVKLRENEWVRTRTGRSHGSVERKFQNISAVLLELGSGDFLRGYVPLRNAQQALRMAVGDRWRREPEIENLMIAEAKRPLSTLDVDIAWAPSAPPAFAIVPAKFGRHRTPIRTDFLKLDADRRDVGVAGERAVVELERATLRRQGLQRLARLVEHVSQTRGDGLGYDVLSFDSDGGEKFIEVKTTRRQREFPFLVTRNEVDFSVEEDQRFHLYRVFDFGRPKTGLFTVRGALDTTCCLVPTLYAARPARVTTAES